MKIILLYGLVWEGLPELITFEQRPEQREGRSRYLELDRRKSMCKGPEAGLCLSYLKYSKEAGMSAAE